MLLFKQSLCIHHMCAWHTPVLKPKPLLQQVPFGASGRDHLLKSYRESLLSVMLNQFDRNKRFRDGMQVQSQMSHG